MATYKFLLVFLALLGITACGDVLFDLPSPTTGSISGHVKDSVTGRDIKDAVLVLDDPSALPGSTNDAGNYAILEIKPGLHTVRISKDSYISDTGNKVLFKDLYLPTSIQAEVKVGAITLVDFALKPTTGVIKGVVKREIRERDPTSGDLVGREVRVSKARITTDPATSAADSSAEGGEDKGRYIIRYVREGTYTVIAAKDGFFTIKKSEIRVKAGESVVVDFMFN